MGAGSTRQDDIAPACVEIQPAESSQGRMQLYKRAAFCDAVGMKLKKSLLLLPVLLMTGCAATFTRLTPLEQPRNPNNLYPVEVQFNSPQQSLRRDSIKPYVQVNGDLYPLRPVEMVQNRWEGFVPVPVGANTVSFRFKFDYLYNNIGTPPKPDSAWSSLYQLRITDR